jgi:hypothetical protein
MTEEIVAELIRQPQKEGGTLVWLIPLGVEQSWKGNFFPLVRNFVDALCGGEKSHGSRRIVLMIDNIISSEARGKNVAAAESEVAAIVTHEDVGAWGGVVAWPWNSWIGVQKGGGGVFS